MRRFAEGTEVSVEKSRAEIETMLVRYGCSDFGYRVQPTIAGITFEVKDRRVRFTMRLPDREDKRYATRVVRGLRRPVSPDQRFKLWDQDCRRLWRCLALSIKAKLEAVQSGISEFESEFLAQIVDPISGQTMAEIVRPQLAARYAGLPAPEAPIALPAPESNP